MSQWGQGAAPDGWPSRSDPARTPPVRLTSPPTGAPAGWYRDPYGYPLLRYFDGLRWTPRTAGLLEPPRHTGEHPVLDLRVAIGAAAVLIVSLIASRVLLEGLVGFGWPVAVYAVISIVAGYGPSVAWCVLASRRWGSGNLIRDVGLHVRWSDAGWGPLVWLGAVVFEILMVLIVQLTGIPLVGNTEGLRDLDLERSYVVALLIGTVVAAPVVEEMVFRGLMLRGLRSRVGAVAAVGGQGVLFGVAHVDPARGSGNIGLALILAAVGVVFGAAAYLLRRIGPTIIAHAIFNGIVMVVVLTR